MILLNVIMGSFNLFAVQELSIGQSENVYLNPSLPSGAWITSASWTTDVIGLECSYSGEWGTNVTAYGYWDDVATVSCFYTYSYYGADNKIHVSHGDAYYYFTCKGYPVTLSPTSVNLDPGETATLTFSISGASIGQIAPRWESSNTSVATVYESGTYSARVTAKQPGTCIITCYSYMGKPVTCSVKVNSIQPTSISIDPSETIVTVDKTVSLRCVFTPSYASSSVTWKSQNSSIASISSTGTVTGIKAGRTTVTATTTNGLTAQCSITVTDKYINPRGPVSKSLDGAGTSSNPYKIKTAADLRYLADKVNSGTDFSGKYFLQTADIVINPYEYDSEKFKSGEVWIPIGDEDKPFRGNYDGGNYVISGLFISNQDQYADIKEVSECDAFGLFGVIGSSSTISNLFVTNALIEGIGESIDKFAGAIIGQTEENIASSSFRIYNCHVTNTTINGFFRCIAGIINVGYASRGGTVDKCSNSANIINNMKRDSHKYTAAGICGGRSFCNTLITNCVNIGEISAQYPSGIAYASGDIYNCCNAGHIEASFSSQPIAAGILHLRIVGDDRYTHAKISNCLNYGELSSSNTYNCGAILGELWSGNINLYNNIFEESTKLYGKNSNSNNYSVYSYDNTSCTSSELQSSSIISKLNSNLESGWCHWVKGNNGYPTLDYYAELSGIDEITMENSFDDLDFTLPYVVYNIEGLIMSDSIDNLAPGIYIVQQGLKTKKIAVQ